MKKIFFILLLVGRQLNCDTNQTQSHTQPHLERLHKALKDSKILHWLDGSLIDRDVIRNTRWAMQELIKMKLGDTDKNTKQRTGKLMLHNKLVPSISNLMQDELVSQVDQNYLPSFKERFDEIIKPLMQKAKGAEKIMLKFIQESCNARNRKDSLLMDWKGDEHDKSFKNKIQTFKDLNIFFTDMLNFFIDLNESCPKAVKAYEDSLKK